jgi:hypothetical protein
MPTDPVKRIEAWDAKFNVTRVAATLTDRRAKMLEHVTSTFISLASMESQVKQTCDASGVPTIQYPFYLCFGREMWSRLNKEMSGESLAQEAAVLIAKWVARGLTAPVLQAIRSEVFNVPAPIAP